MTPKQFEDLAREEFEKFVREKMRERFVLWWSNCDWCPTHTIREMAIAQDAYAEGWVAGVALVLGMAPSEQVALPSPPTLPDADG